MHLDIRPIACERCSQNKTNLKKQSKYQLSLSSAGQPFSFLEPWRPSCLHVAAVDFAPSHKQTTKHLLCVWNCTQRTHPVSSQRLFSQLVGGWVGECWLTAATVTAELKSGSSWQPHLANGKHSTNAARLKWLGEKEICKPAMHREHRDNTWETFSMRWLLLKYERSKFMARGRASGCTFPIQAHH